MYKNIDYTLSVNELEETIKEYHSLNLNEVSIPIIKELFLKIIKGFHVFPLEWKKGTLYRTRKHNDCNLFMNISELIYPLNPEKYGRFNNIGQSIFYGTMNRDTAFVESRLKTGDKVTLLESERINLNRTPMFMEIGVKELIIEQKYHPEFTELNNLRFKNLLNTEEKKQRYQLINTFLIKEITRIVTDDNIYLYKATIPIGEFYLSNKETIGLMYPSISRNGTGCLAIKPEAYHQYFKPFKCYKCNVLRSDGNNQIELYCENESTNIDNEGNIKWKI